MSKMQNATRSYLNLKYYMNLNAIFKYNCKTYKDVYIDETKRQLFVSQYEHLGRSSLTEKPLK